MAEIQFKGITKRYPDGFEAVKAIDLDIADGEFMILVGPSGCGKSTALRMIAGLEDITDGKAWIVWEFDGKPLAPEHGGPVRLLVPHLYFWKSAKWITRIELMDHDEQGFWERNGYHDRGDPWLEQRYQGDA